MYASTTFINLLRECVRPGRCACSTNAAALKSAVHASKLACRRAGRCVLGSLSCSCLRLRCRKNQSCPFEQFVMDTCKNRLKVAVLNTSGTLSAADIDSLAEHLFGSLPCVDVREILLEPFDVSWEESESSDGGEEDEVRKEDDEVEVDEEAIAAQLRDLLADAVKTRQPPPKPEEMDHYIVEREQARRRRGRAARSSGSGASDRCAARTEAAGGAGSSGPAAREPTTGTAVQGDASALEESAVPGTDAWEGELEIVGARGLCKLRSLTRLLPDPELAEEPKGRNDNGAAKDVAMDMDCLPGSKATDAREPMEGGADDSDETAVLPVEHGQHAGSNGLTDLAVPAAAPGEAALSCLGAAVVSDPLSLGACAVEGRAPEAESPNGTDDGKVVSERDFSHPHSEADELLLVHGRSVSADIAELQHGLLLSSSQDAHVPPLDGLAYGNPRRNPVGQPFVADAETAQLLEASYAQVTRCANDEPPVHGPLAEWAAKVVEAVQAMQVPLAATRMAHVRELLQDMKAPLTRITSANRHALFNMQDTRAGYTLYVILRTLAPAVGVLQQVWLPSCSLFWVLLRTQLVHQVRGCCRKPRHDMSYCLASSHRWPCHTSIHSHATLCHFNRCPCRSSPAWGSTLSCSAPSPVTPLALQHPQPFCG
jgi:hypothetical protein